ncbi:MAG: type II secretion system protein GspG [Planctomycetota bacterium]|jgi:type II secretion system protein G
MEKGDLYFDQALGLLRGALVASWRKDRFIPTYEPVRAYKLFRLPCRLLVTTAEKKHFDVTVQSVTQDGGLHLEYRPADPSLAPSRTPLGTVVKSRLRLLQIAFETYRTDNGRYPTTTEGFGALFKPPAHLPYGAHWGGAVISDLRPDPWGNPYQYEYDPKQKRPRTWSFGPDGKDGTEDDVSAGDLEDLPVDPSVVPPEPPGGASAVDTRRVKRYLNLLKTACEAYRLDVGRYPTTVQGLHALAARPAEGSDSEKWIGPYVDAARIPLDPWGHSWQYEYDEKQKRPRIWSSGPDGKSGTEDDVTAGD